VKSIGLNEVTSVYSGPQGDLFAILMGQQLHVGGMNGSIDLAERAEIGAGLRGIDLCCGTGGGMRVRGAGFRFATKSKNQVTIRRNFEPKSN